MFSAVSISSWTTTTLVSLFVLTGSVDDMLKHTKVVDLGGRIG